MVDCFVSRLPSIVQEDAQLRPRNLIRSSAVKRAAVSRIMATEGIRPSRTGTVGGQPPLAIEIALPI